MTTLRAPKELFYAIFLVLLLPSWLFILIGTAIEYFKDQNFIPIERTLFAFLLLSLFPVFLSLPFLRYKLTIDEEEFCYRNLFTKKTLRFDEIDYARHEHGFKKPFELFAIRSRFVVYPKPDLNRKPIVMNGMVLENFKVIIKKIESLGKLKRTKSY